MITPFRDKTVRLFCAIAAVAMAAVHPLVAEQGDATGIVDTIAAKAGMSDLSLCKEIRFTYSARSSEGSVRHQWQWFPGTDDVIYTGKDPSGKKGTVTYSRKALADLRKEAQVHIVDAWFVNDIYWLLFPYFLKTDPQKRMTRNSSAVMPLSGKWATGITVEYYKPDVRRPGSKFDIFVDSSYQIQEWVVYPYESNRAIAANKWVNYRRAGPFTLSFDRLSKNGKGISVKISNVKIGMADR